MEVVDLVLFGFSVAPVSQDTAISIALFVDLVLYGSSIAILVQTIQAWFKGPASFVVQCCHHAAKTWQGKAPEH